MFKQFFAAIVKPNLKYEAPIWNHHSKERIILIRNVQGMAANQVQGISDTIQRKARNHVPTNSAAQEISRIYYWFMMKTLLAISLDFVRTIGSITLLQST